MELDTVRGMARVVLGVRGTRRASGTTPTKMRTRVAEGQRRRQGQVAVCGAARVAAALWITLRVFLRDGGRVFPDKSPGKDFRGRNSRFLSRRARQGLKQGSRVRHPKYGEGTVFRREGDGDDAKITVQFQQHGVKKLVEKFAQLERI